VDDKAPAVGAPRDDVRISVPLDLVQHGVQLEGEGDGHPAPAPGLVGVIERVMMLLIVVRRRVVLAVVVGVVGVVRVVMVVVHHEVPVVQLGRLSGLLGLAAALRAGLCAVVMHGARREDGVLQRELAPGRGSGNQATSARRGGGGGGRKLGQGEAPEQALRQDARAHLELIGIQRHRLDAAVGGIGYAHGPLTPRGRWAADEEEVDDDDDDDDDDPVKVKMDRRKAAEPRAKSEYNARNDAGHRGNSTWRALPYASYGTTRRRPADARE
jgi:hypothetical protein